MANEKKQPSVAIEVEKRAWSTPVVVVLNLADAENSGSAAPDPSIAQAVS